MRKFLILVICFLAPKAHSYKHSDAYTSFLKLESQVRNVKAKDKDLIWQLNYVNSPLSTQARIQFLQNLAPSMIDRSLVLQSEQEGLLTLPVVKETLNLSRAYLGLNNDDSEPDDSEILRIKFQGLMESFVFQSQKTSSCYLNYYELHTLITKILYNELLSTQTNEIICAAEATQDLLNFLDESQNKIILQQIIKKMRLENGKYLPTNQEEESYIRLIKAVQKRKQQFDGSAEEKWKDIISPTKEKIKNAANRFYKIFGYASENIPSAQNIRDGRNFRGFVDIISWPHDIRWALKWDMLENPLFWGTYIHEMGHYIHAQNIAQNRFVYQKLSNFPELNEAIGILFGELAWKPYFLQTSFSLTDHQYLELKNSGLIVQNSQVLEKMVSLVPNNLIRRKLLLNTHSNFAENGINAVFNVHSKINGIEINKETQSGVYGLKYKDYASLLIIYDLYEFLRASNQDFRYLKALVLASNLIKSFSNTTSMTENSYNSFNAKLNKFFARGATANLNFYIKTMEISKESDVRFRNFENYIMEQL